MSKARHILEKAAQMANKGRPKKDMEAIEQDAEESLAHEAQESPIEEKAEHPVGKRSKFGKK